MKFKYVFYRYKTVPFSKLEHKAIKKVKLKKFDDILDHEFLLVIRTYDGEQFIISDYPTGTPQLMTLK